MVYMELTGITMAIRLAHAHIEYPPVAITHESRSRARFLLNGHYSNIYGPQIRLESTRSIRVKIMELEALMPQHRHVNPPVYKTLARQCTDFERICALIELLS